MLKSNLKLVYSFESHYSYLDYVLSHKKGMKAEFAQFLNFKKPYLSRILKGEASLSPEQGIKASDYLCFNENESSYFLLLLSRDRATSKELISFYTKQVQKIQNEKNNLKNYFDDSSIPPLEIRHKYYSSWYYSAIHVMLSIPNVTLNQISEILNLPRQLVSEVVEFLEEAQFVRDTDQGFKVTNQRTYIDRDSSLVQINHTNWRSKSLQSVEVADKNNLHYSNVMAISKNDFERIKEILITSISQTRDVIKDSPEEKVYAMTLDCYGL